MRLPWNTADINAIVCTQSNMDTMCEGVAAA
jgi:hypothetical protein